MAPPPSPASTSQPTQLPRPWTKRKIAVERRKVFGPEEQQNLLHVMETCGGGSVPMLRNNLSLVRVA